MLKQPVAQPVVDAGRGGGGSLREAMQVRTHLDHRVTALSSFLPSSLRLSTRCVFMLLLVVLLHQPHLLTLALPPPPPPLPPPPPPPPLPQIVKERVDGISRIPLLSLLQENTIM